ncbi:MAG: preprotein translocase subunit YajC [Candidatus Eisenbacteria bacterium]|nr:preprotein translocase subunit YajC [Candidatus Eisenbacteria bacterium]
MGTTGAPSGQTAGGGPGMLFMLVAIFAIFYFLMIRPESKRRKERQQMIDSLQRGDKVVTVGGLYGEIQDVHDDKVVLRVAENVKVEVAKSAISGKRS